MLDMSTIQYTKEMCDKLVGALSYIDNEPDSELIQKLKTYRQELINLPNTIVEGEWPASYPVDPREYYK